MYVHMYVPEIVCAYVHAHTCTYSSDRTYYTYSYAASTPYSLPTSCTVLKMTLITSTSDSKYVTAIPFALDGTN